MLAYILGLIGPFAPLLATLGRLGGWCAHTIEKRRQPSYFHSTSVYEGDKD